jgi:phospholipid/cholesterol/gamma-HCH transport system substrate-binding protein
VGNVTELAIQPDQPQNVLVTLLVKSDTVVREDSKASIEMAGLTGPSYVEISGGSTGAKKLDGKASATDAPVIPAIKSKMQDLLEGTQQLVQDFRAVTNQVKELLSADNQKSVHDMLAHLSSTTAVLDEHSNDLGNILKNFDTASGKILTTLGKTDDTLDSARTVMTSANHAIGTLEDTLAAGKTTVVRVGQLSDHIDKAVTGLDVTQINRLMAEARVMVANITRLSTGLEREPGKIIYGDSRQGYSPR